MKLLALWLAAVNLLGLGLMAADKRAARLGRRRVPERRFFLLAALGAAPGCLGGMYLFHHKTRHRKFTLGMPALLACQLLLALFFCRGFL